jgi:hypothetical protein
MNLEQWRQKKLRSSAILSSTNVTSSHLVLSPVLRCKNPAQASRFCNIWLNCTRSVDRNGCVHIDCRSCCNSRQVVSHLCVSRRGLHYIGGRCPLHSTLLRFPIYGPHEKLYSQVSLEQGRPHYRHLLHIATARIQKKKLPRNISRSCVFPVYLRNYGLICLCYCINIFLILRAITRFVKEPYFHHRENKFSPFLTRTFFKMMYVQEIFEWLSNC